MRRSLVVPLGLFSVALCGCAPGRSTVALTVDANGTVAGISSLQVTATVDKQVANAATITLADASVTIPPAMVVVDLFFDSNRSGESTVAVSAFDGANHFLASGTSSSFLLVASASLSATVVLNGPSAGDMGVDAAVDQASLRDQKMVADDGAPDLAARDSSIDLAVPDLALLDLGKPDLAVPDLTAVPTPDLTMLPDLVMPDFTAGGCANNQQCAGLPHATGQCTKGECAILSCNPGYADCDKSPGNGCEVTTSSDISNCGSCARVCSAVANGSIGCANGICGIGMCDPQFADCDKSPANGCEINTSNNVNDCGACGNACTFANATNVCSGGMCLLGLCNQNFANCDLNPANGCEANLQTDVKNCGKCASVCPMNMPSCVNGACRACALTFAAHSDFPTGMMPVAIALGDFTGDGKADLVTANFGDSTFTILANSGNAVFAVQATPLATSNPSSIALADLNGDNRLDVIVANSTNVNGGDISVRLNSGASPWLNANAHTFADGAAPSAVAIGDVNGDGKPDLVAANNLGANASVFLNAGNVMPEFAAAVSYAVGMSPTSIAIGDLNGDTKPDLAVVDNGTGTVSILLNSGNGTFAPASNNSAGASAMSVAIGDLDGDGALDLAVANFGGNTVSVLLNNGHGVFAAQVPYAADAEPRSVAIGDLNGDGKLDIAVTCSGANDVSVLLNNGNGTFAQFVSFPVGMQPASVAIGDLNGDGKPDLAVANAGSATVSILINQCM